MKILKRKEDYVYTTNRYTRTPEERFWQNVDKLSENECWNWKAGIDAYGYGVIQVKGKKICTHKFSYQINKGEIPKGLCVLHSCHNRKCCNPNHLRSGTHQENMRDLALSGRAHRTQGCPDSLSKFSEEDVIAIIKSTDSGKNLSKKYNVYPITIYKIKRKSWANIQKM